jgi:hypothetical protein
MEGLNEEDITSVRADGASIIPARIAFVDGEESACVAALLK